ncbi:MAG TPA: cytochrome c oxidase subunit 3 [Terriglobales bacterium]|jgi:cytochrome c oxidase subunit 3|nr:cytochrome c oxidase subunit 3 [Terriglobales bacterium]
MADVAVQHHVETAYEPSLFGTYSNKIGMWLFILSDSLTFGALLYAYSYGRISNPDWPTPFHSESIINATVMTAFLLTSSLTMVLAVAAANEGNRQRTIRWLAATMFCGTAFVVLHAREWLGLIHEGMTPKGNPWAPGVPQFGGTFFTITGLHMLHVAIGVVILGVMLVRSMGKKFSANDVETSGLYWHFVDLVWMFVFPLVYLMSTKIE